jgi:hypothetical protein
MTTQFNETAPGVHTATLTNPKSKRLHNIAVIESCGAFQLFIDGELQERDLPSFRTAVAAAKRKMSASGSLTMAHAAGILVLLSVGGGSAIGVTKIFGLGSEPASAYATRAPVSAAPNTFKAVKAQNSPASKPAPTLINTAAQADVAERAIAFRSPYAARRDIAETMSKAPATATNLSVIANQDAKPSASIAASIRRMAPIVITSTTPKAAQAVTTSDITTASTKIITPVSLPVGVEQPSTIDQFSVTPPLPVKLKEDSDRAQIQTASVPVQRPTINSAVKVVNGAVSTPVEIEKPRQRRSTKINNPRERRFRLARSNSRQLIRNKRSHRAAISIRKRRAARRIRHSSRRIRTAVIMRARRPALRMVCIAHSCRFR